MHVHEDADKITLATYQVDGEADRWWRPKKQTQDIPRTTWTGFVDLFMEEYFLLFDRIKGRCYFHLSQMLSQSPYLFHRSTLTKKSQPTSINYPK